MIKLNTVFFLAASSILAVTHFVIIELFLYWRYLWLDIPMHVLGGSVVALGAFVPYDLRVPLPRRWLELVPVMSFVLIVALSWEVYELSIGIPVDASYFSDTITDLFMGILGGFLGYIVGSRLQKLSLSE